MPGYSLRVHQQWERLSELTGQPFLGGHVTQVIRLHTAIWPLEATVQLVPNSILTTV